MKEFISILDTTAFLLFLGSVLVSFLMTFSIPLATWSKLSRSVFALGLSALLWLSCVNGIYLVGRASRGDKLAETPVAQAAAPSATQQQQQPSVNPLIQMRSNFLKDIETLIQNPQLIVEKKMQVFSAYAQLFPNGAPDILAYKANVLKVYECQLHFLEDAMQTLKTKKVVKSAKRNDCENSSGAFYFREKLITPEAQMSNQRTLELIAKGEAIPTGNGKTQVADEKLIKGFIADSKKVLDYINIIFQ